MTTTPFPITYLQQGQEQHAEVHPCCKENDIVDYAVYQEGKLLFTVTKPTNERKWVVAMKNADDEIVDDAIQSIGLAIEKHTNH